MSQLNHKYDYTPAPKRETHGLPAISSVPSNALSGDADPTVEIRHLITQLQTSVREARDRVAVVERERDQIRDELDNARAKLLEINTREEESRARFVEVTSVIRERDELAASLEQYHKTIAELQRRIDLAQRQDLDQQRQRGAVILERDQAVRERDAANAAKSELARERDEARGRLNEVQRQVVSLRQARDSSQSLCHELTDKVQALTDELAELSHDYQAAKAGTKELQDLRHRCETITADRDRLAGQLAEAGRELETQRQRLLDLAEQQTKMAQTSTEHATALAAAREDVIKLTQEREAARNRAQEKGREVEELREEVQRLRSSPPSGEVTSEERTAFEQRIEAAVAERNALQAQLNLLQEQSLAHERRLSDSAEQLAAAQRGREEVLTSLTAAQKQIDHIIRDRDQVRQQGVDRALELEAQLEATRNEFASMESRIADAERRLSVLQRERDRAMEQAQNYEQQRLQAIDFAAQLDAANREIMRLTADVAEARLEARAAGARAARAKSIAPTPTVSPEPPTPATSTPGATTAGEYDESALSEKEGKEIVAEMKRCYGAFAKTPTDLSLLNELYSHVEHFAERARVSGFLGLHRLAHAVANLAQDLYKFPEQVNPSTMRTLSQAIEFVGTLLKQKNYSSLKDPARATIFAVDDDAENCDAIRMAMENISMRTKTVQEPSAALAELSATPYDLVFLDVALPHMDGFELCQHIRGLPNHARTPIVFLTGLTTMENRVQSSLSGGNDFVGKPFNLHELGVKAISLILKGSLNME